VPLPRWIVPVLTLTAAGLLLWTLWLTYSLPSRHVTQHYDLAWVGFDVALLAAFVVTTWCVVRSSQWLVPAAAATGTMLLCDAWFDVITSEPGGRLEALLEAGLAELPLAILCWFIVYDTERFRQATIVRYSATARKMIGTES
jgi:predicted branched-subunit amino acid permease